MMTLSKLDYDELTGKAWQELVPPFKGMLMSMGEETILAEFGGFGNEAMFYHPGGATDRKYRDYDYPDVSSSKNWAEWTRRVAKEAGKVCSVLDGSTWSITVAEGETATHEEFATALLGALLSCRRKRGELPPPFCEQWERKVLGPILPGPAKYLWLDIETSGLDPRSSRLLECAARVTDSNLAEIGDPFHRVVASVPGTRKICDEFVREMHDANGLWEESFASQVSAPECMRELLAFVREYTGDEKLILAGSSVHFDRSFLSPLSDEFAPALSHRHYDVSSLREMARDLGHEIPESDSTHRAPSDVLASIELAKFIRRLMPAAPGLHVSGIEKGSEC